MNIAEALETLGLYAWLDANERHISAGLRSRVDQARAVIERWVDEGADRGQPPDRTLTPPHWPHPVEPKPPRKLVLEWPLGSGDAVDP
jgi:hypothetical protein